ncbi:FAD-binding oxidoreductase [Echinicola vietnamensis]|uniref:Flavodoxin reductase family protein n=1 Tax=Echinicola vietnamensis (strain DSM 17526 / LMG 23754 / KMM 6221) TaxID=926556 RepID=L0FRP9_ECHVK|nr:FAD-binding oxidoreductase [Echinicola vietnamensis]AGA76594.1 flavodoxin reductase family protein [Echinicola vietnamensis DSM 17526]
MANYRLKILEITPVTHDVNRYKVEKPRGYQFTPGQATEVSLLQAGWEAEKRPFTFTNLPSDDHLEFIIKSYDDHEGVTKRLASLSVGDEVEIGDPWGTISFKGEGVFIAGGAGITPFISILRHLRKKNQVGKSILIFANKTNDDIILFEELKAILGHKFINIIAKQKDTAYDKGLVDQAYLKSKISDFDQHFYVCGPPGFMKAVTSSLKTLGADPDTLVFEQ